MIIDRLISFNSIKPPPRSMMKFFPMILFLFVNSWYLTLAAEATSFPLTLNRARAHYYKTSSSLFKNNLLSSKDDGHYFKYKMVMIATIPIGNPWQPMNMVMDTGSEIGWLRCANRSTNLTKTPPMFVPIQSHTFSEFICNQTSSDSCVTDSSNINCIQPYTWPNPRCHFSYNYEDQFNVEGDLFKDTVNLSGSQSQSTSDSIILGCTSMIEPSGAHGLMGMNLGKLSFLTQANITTFSYCVPLHNILEDHDPPTGKFYLGRNPDSHRFTYVNLLDFNIPSVDKNAYLVLLKYIHIGGERLSAKDEMGPSDTSDGCAMMIDSATQYSFLLSNIYDKLRNKVANLTTDFNLTNPNDEEQFDMCFLRGTKPEIIPMIGDLIFEFENNVTITVPKERILDHIDDKLCVTIGKPAMSSDSATTHILGISHQQCHWVEYDIQQRKVGFLKTESCQQGNHNCR